MTTSNGPGGQASMRFSLHEVLSGRLASIQSDRFGDDTQGLVTMFEGLGQRFPLLAPLAGTIDPDAVNGAFKRLEMGKFIEHRDGSYILTEMGRNACAGSKRTLFNRDDSKQLEEAARASDLL